MTELKLLQKIAQDISEIKQDIEELKETRYPSEEKISKKIIESVKKSEDNYQKRKYQKANTKEEVKKFFDNV